LQTLLSTPTDNISQSVFQGVPEQFAGVEPHFKGENDLARSRGSQKGKSINAKVCLFADEDDAALCFVKDRNLPASAIWRAHFTDPF
jgi:hypothetical protein